jgi:hypothetical protein
MEPRWIGIKGALATRSPSGANRAQEKSRRSLMLVLIEVCCNERPIASATLMNRLAKRVSRIGSGPLLGVFGLSIGTSVGLSISRRRSLLSVLFPASKDPGQNRR